jgi:hypothetical protein
MAYDEELAERIRPLVYGALPDVAVTEKRMFGGLAFLVGGNMALAASRTGDGIMLRCDPAEGERLLAEPGASPMVMRNRELTGWLRVTAEAIADDDVLARWVAIGTSYAGSLPPK